MKLVLFFTCLTFIDHKPEWKTYKLNKGASKKEICERYVQTWIKYSEFRVYVL